MKPIDYKELLLKYMNHVGECEGIVFVGTYLYGDPNFTEEEVKELFKLAGIDENELRKKGK